MSVENPWNRTAELTVKRLMEERSGIYRIPGCRMGSSIPTVMEDLKKREDYPDLRCPATAALHTAWLGSLVAKSWPKGEDI